MLMYNGPMNSVWSFFYTLILSLWIGGMAFFTFIITPVIFRAYDRDMAGKIVGGLFPSYYLYTIVLSVLALLMLVALRTMFLSWGFKLSLILVAAAIAVNIFTSVKLHPAIKEVKKEIHAVETPAADSPLRKRFGKLHAVSASLNLLVLADGIALLFISGVMKNNS